MSDGRLKGSVFGYWNKASCGTEFTAQEKHTREYYDELEQHRYRVEPEVFSFAQFTRHHGQKMLEIGVGAGHDFTQWVRAGTDAYGIDLTQEGVEHVKKRLAIYGLVAREVRQADCEALPYSDDTFDLVYSWGVIHHTPDTRQALREIVRVCRPGGTCKIMVYHRYSLVAFHLWLRYALFKGKPWRSFAWCVANYMESPDTKSYRGREIGKWLSELPVENVRISTVLTNYDALHCFGTLIDRFVRHLLGDRAGWFMLIQCTKSPA